MEESFLLHCVELSALGNVNKGSFCSNIIGSRLNVLITT